MELLREPGRLDLIVAPAAPRERPARRAASGVAAAVAACSPPRGRQQVSGAGRGRSGRLALASKGWIAGGSRRQLRPLGARLLRGGGNGGAGGGAGTPSDSLLRQQHGWRLPLSGARMGGVQGAAHAGNAGRAIGQGKGRVLKGQDYKSVSVAGFNNNGIAVGEGGERQGGSMVSLLSGGGGQESWGQGRSSNSGEEVLMGQFEGVGGGKAEEGEVKELSHILEWSDESDQEGGEVKEQVVEDDGLIFKVRPPVRTYGGFARGESVSEGVGEVKGSEIKRRTQSVGDSHLSDADVGFLQGGQCGSEGDPGELLTGLEPWEEEEVTAGPSTASWTGYRRGGKAVRAKEVVTQYATGSGFEPPSGRVSKGQRPGYASQREGLKTALRRPRIPAAHLEDIIKKARFGSGTRDADSDESNVLFCAPVFTLAALIAVRMADPDHPGQYEEDKQEEHVLLQEKQEEQKRNLKEFVVWQ
ncbi:hypothetical protein NDU88_001535 [Pleurodeles waltl]|uniref:Uncharacterized protein n=1 Tax=Pleurodeles waltl TaxID=8319 RepID=A0AAV7MUX8_PLEWA|nr:hypothetical protein NDU88_001535 [Pleurodeles waltl]